MEHSQLSILFGVVHKGDGGFEAVLLGQVIDMGPQVLPSMVN